jgi:hypothetical protein
MDINDYSQKYRDLRSDYSDQTRKLKEHYDEKLQNVADINEAQRAEYKKGYQNSVDRMAKSHENNIDHAQDSFATKSKTDKGRYSKELLKEREQFAKERAETQNKFNSRLSNLENTFQTSAEENEKRYNNDINYLDKYFNKVESQRKSKFDTDQEKYHSDLDKSVHQMNLGHKDDLRSLNIEAAKERHLLQEDLNKKNDFDRRAARADFVNLKEARDLDAAKQQENFERSKDSLVNVKNEEMRKVIGTNEDRMSELNRKNMHNEQATIRSFGEQKRVDDRSHSYELEQVRRKLGDIQDQNNGESYSALMKKDVKENHDRNIVRLKKTLEDREIRGERDKEDLRRNYSDSLGKTKQEYSKEVDQKIKNESSIYGKQLIKAKQEKDMFVDNYETKLNNLNDQYWRDMHNQKNDMQEVVDLRTGAYAESFRRLSEDKANSIDSLKSIQSDEKKDYIMAQRSENFENIEDMRDNMFKNFNKEIEKYKNALTLEKERSVKMEDDYTRMMSNQRDQFTKELNLVKRDSDDRRVEERRNAKRAIYQAEVDNNQKMKELRTVVEKRISQDRTQFEIEKSRLIDSYENKIKEIRSADASENRVQLSRLENDINSQKLAYDTKIEGLTRQYEDRIDSLKNENLELKELKKTRAESLG